MTRSDDRTASGAESRLATYGSLVPGGPNHGQLSELSGRWLSGRVRGVLAEQGWGADLGYPGLKLDEAGDSLDVQVFESADLVHHWERLDAFEGDGYRRTPVEVATAEGVVVAFIYVLADG